MLDNYLRTKIYNSKGVIVILNNTFKNILIYYKLCI